MIDDVKLLPLRVLPKSRGFDTAVNRPFNCGT